MKIYYSIVSTPINDLLYSYTETDELFETQWLTNDDYGDKIKNYEKKKWDFFENQLELYFKGKLKQFDIKLYEYEYSDFTRNVLEELKKIPYGKTLSYKMVAQNINKPKASRSVGSVCKRNYFPIIIPCHRVVASGSLGGYMGKRCESKELEIKKRLLAMEDNQTTTP